MCCCLNDGNSTNNRMPVCNRSTDFGFEYKMLDDFFMESLNEINMKF